MIITRPPILDALEKAGHRVFENGDYNLNIIGIRRTKNPTVDKFDDIICCVYKVNGYWHFQSWQATTDPGIRYLGKKKMGNKKGTAILQPGQYSGCWTLDYHRGKYLALCQRGGDVNVWRDYNKDGELNYEGKTFTGRFGINIHRSRGHGELAENVGPHSAGCQVFRRAEDLDALLWLCKKQTTTHPHWKKAFTYTLIEE